MARSTYFESYRAAQSDADKLPSLEARAAKAALRQRRLNGQQRSPEPTPIDFPKLPAKPREASARHSRAPSTSTASSPSQLSLSIFADTDLSRSLSTEDMDGLIDALPRSPGRRRGRSRDPVQNGSTRPDDVPTQKQRQASNDFDWHGRQLRARLQHLTNHEKIMTETDVVEDWRNYVSGSISPTSSSSFPSSLLPSYRPSRKGSTTQCESPDPIPIPLELSPYSGSPFRMSPVPVAKIESLLSDTSPSESSRNLVGRIPSINDLVRQHNARLTKTAGQAFLSRKVPSYTNFSLDITPPEEDQDDDDENNTPDRASEDAGAYLSTPSMRTMSLDDDGASFLTLQASRRDPIDDNLADRETDVSNYVHSPRLTRLLTLFPGTSKRVTVSYADVGLAAGHPVFVYLGLGCARHLVALFNELAAAEGLRIVCIDRWGNGYTTNIPSRNKGFLEWAEVVEEVANRLAVPQFSILAHSAGSPYAFATSLRCPNRIAGSIHLLAPWVHSNLDGQSTSYKWLRLVPNRVLASAQTAEWKLQAWRLGKPTSLAQADPVGFDPKAPVSSTDYEPVDVVSEDPRGDQRSTSRSNSSSTIFKSVTRTSSDDSTKSYQRGLPKKSSASSLPRGSKTALNRSTSVLEVSLSKNRKRHASNGQTSDASAFTTAILQASHAESLQGGNHDLLAMLERTDKPLGFTYAEVQAQCKIWYGQDDDRISLASIRALEQALPNATVTILPKADHNLLTNVSCMFQVLQSLAADRLHSSLPR